MVSTPTPVSSATSLTSVYESEATTISFSVGIVMRNYQPVYFNNVNCQQFNIFSSITTKQRTFCVHSSVNGRHRLHNISKRPPVKYAGFFLSIVLYTESTSTMTFFVFIYLGCESSFPCHKNREPVEDYVSSDEAGRFYPPLVVNGEGPSPLRLIRNDQLLWNHVVHTFFL